jgi:hypothetical protein
MIGFLWRAGKGYRLRPWRSPLLRWRIETYWGLEADRITTRDFLKFTWTHRGELLRFLRWADRMETSRRATTETRPWAIAPDESD